MPYEFTESVMETWHRPIESSEQQETTAVTQTTAVAAQTQTTAVTTASDAQMTQTSTAVQDGTLPNVLTPEQLKRIKMIVLSIAVLILLAAGYYAVHCRIISRRNRAMHDRHRIILSCRCWQCAGSNRISSHMMILRKKQKLHASCCPRAGSGRFLRLYRNLYSAAAASPMRMPKRYLRLPNSLRRQCIRKQKQRKKSGCAGSNT